MVSKVKKTHFGLLLFLASNILIQILFGLELDNRLIFLLKIFTYLSGIALLIFTIKRRSLLTFYASLYILSPIIVVIGWMADGILGGILGSVFLGLWGPPESLTDSKSIIKNGNYKIESQFSGFLGGCCSYELSERKFFLFNSKIAEFRAEHLPSNILKFKVSNEQAFIYYKNEPLDSTIVQIK